MPIFKTFNNSGEYPHLPPTQNQPTIGARAHLRYPPSPSPSPSPHPIPLFCSLGDTRGCAA